MSAEKAILCYELSPHEASAIRGGIALEANGADVTVSPVMWLVNPELAPEEALSASIALASIINYSRLKIKDEDKEDVIMFPSFGEAAIEGRPNAMVLVSPRLTEDELMREQLDLANEINNHLVAVASPYNLPV